MKNHHHTATFKMHVAHNANKSWLTTVKFDDDVQNWMAGFLAG